MKERSTKEQRGDWIIVFNLIDLLLKETNTNKYKHSTP